MDETDILRIWLNKATELKNWPKPEEWSNHEFQVLSEEISNVSGILINRNTLRKLVSHLSQGKAYSPRSSTKDAFALYIGFSSWRQFEESIQPIGHKSRKHKQLYWILPIIGISVIVALVLLKNQNIYYDYDFEITNPVGDVPHTVEFNYNFKNIKTNNIKVDFGHIDPTGVYLLKDMDKNSNIHKECFHYPGGYNVRLFFDEKLNSSHDVWINSDGWFTYVVDIRPYLTAVELPTWLLDAGVPTNHHIPFDAIIEPDTLEEGVIQIPENKISQLGHISANYHTHYKYFKDFGVDMNNCEFSIRFKDSRFGMGTHCHEAALYLNGEGGKIGFKFAEEGCSKYTQQRIGDKFISGEKSNLDYLILSYREFTTVNIKSTNDSIYLSVNGVKRKTLPNDQNLGVLRGLHLWFKGSPYIDFVRLTDDKGELVFEAFE